MRRRRSQSGVGRIRGKGRTKNLRRDDRPLRRRIRSLALHQQSSPRTPSSTCSTLPTRIPQSPSYRLFPPSESLQQISKSTFLRSIRYSRIASRVGILLVELGQLEDHARADWEEEDDSSTETVESEFQSRDRRCCRGRSSEWICGGGRRRGGRGRGRSTGEEDVDDFFAVRPER